ncbi:hypothetical protein FHT76_002686 [Rhizobium sp. BK176]|nr:hypothetical protein [Rhizobium sp. BK176]
MKFDAGYFSFQVRPFSLTFLDPVLSEYSLPSLERWANRVCVECLRDGNQLDRPIRSSALQLGCSNTRAYIVQSLF